MKKNKSSSKQLIGGQAVIEGVMIKSNNYIATSIRKKGEIITKREKVNKPRYKWTKWIFIRGTANLVDMLIIGTKSLIWSANQAANEESEFKKSELILTLILAFGFVVLFFIALPYFLTNVIGIKEETKPLLFNLVDGIIKIVLFLLYIFVISFMKDVKRLFQYHGAEHKSVHCYETGEDLTIENIKKFSTIHPRCGTSFIMFVFISSIFIFSILPIIILFIYPSFIQLRFIYQKLVLFPLRILIIPVIAGVSYEILRLTAKYNESIFMRFLMIPGLWLQKITTREPTAKQIEVAIKSVTSVIKIRST